MMTQEEERYLRAIAAKMDAVARAHKELQKKCRSGPISSIRTSGRRLIADTHRLLRAL